MPELPEVETVVRDLRPKVLRIAIKNIEILLPRIVKNRPAEFKKNLINNEFSGIERIGKLMIFRLQNGGKAMLVHLKMTGQLVYCQGEKIVAGGHDDGTDPTCLPDKWTRVVFHFADGGRLCFNDMRTFGYLSLADTDKLSLIRRRYGPDPLTSKFTLADFKRTIKDRHTSIKALLLNQEIIAGLGNIYVDEILYRAGVRPARKASGLKNFEIEAIYGAVKPVLQRAIKNRGTTFNNYVDGNGQRGNFVRLLKVYGRQGKSCKRCGTAIKKAKVAGRGTHYCPVCQS